MFALWSQHRFIPREGLSRYWEQFLCKDFLPYLFLTLAKEHWWVPFNLSVPTPLQQHSQAATCYLTARTCHWKLSFPLESALECCINKQVTITNFSWAIITGAQHTPKMVQDHVDVLRTVKNTLREAPAILKHLYLQQGDREGGEFEEQASGKWKKSLQGLGSFRWGRCTTASPCTLALHEELG